MRVSNQGRDVESDGARLLTSFGVRGQDRALKRGDMSPRPKAATCRRTPNPDHAGVGTGAGVGVSFVLRPPRMFTMERAVWYSLKKSGALSLN